jgi:hypothetical protein
MVLVAWQAPLAVGSLRSQEVARLADLLREHGIEPGTGDRKSA